MTTAESTAGDKTSILIVDDDEVYRNRLARAFVDRGYDVRTAQDYDSAVASATQDSPVSAGDGSPMPGPTASKTTDESRPSERDPMLKAHTR